MEITRIKYATGARKAVITLNRPEKRNALDDVMVRELTQAFQAAGKETAVRAVVLEAAGQAFCAGADLEYLRTVAEYDLEENRADSFRLANLFRTIYELRKPVIAAVQGAALAGGCGLASACDLVVASREHAQFGYTEARIGFVPAIVMLFLINRIGEGRARDLVLRGRVIDAEEAQQLGLINTVVPHAALGSSATRLADEITATGSPTSLGLCKEMLSKLHGLNLMDALDFAANMNAASRMTPDCKRGVAAFLNKEKVEW